MVDVLSAASRVRERLREDILAGRLLPSSRLRIQGVADHYECGVIPVREALNQLAAQDLVVHEEQRGFSVAPVSQSSLVELTRARSGIYEVALRESIARGGAEWEESVLLAHYRLSKVQRYLSIDPPESNPRYDELHRGFHRALVAACGSQWMIDICDRLFDHAERYRILSRHLAVVSREVEHDEIMKAALNRETAEAIGLLKAHVERTATIVLTGSSAAGNFSELSELGGRGIQNDYVDRKIQSIK